ncbi:Transmembrane emp24 domain-containing protein [Drosera capensis]
MMTLDMLTAAFWAYICHVPMQGSGARMSQYSALIERRLRFYLHCYSSPTNSISDCFASSIVSEAQSRVCSSSGFSDKLQMKTYRPCSAAILVQVMVILLSVPLAFGLRFSIVKQECFSHKVDYGWDTVRASFVVVKYDSSQFREDGVDLVVTGPAGNQVMGFWGRTSEKFEFVAEKKGVYRFCFTNKSPFAEIIDFDVLVGHFMFNDDLAKDDHLKPLTEQIQQLGDALIRIRFIQHWIEAHGDRLATANESMSKRALHKALFESAALLTVSGLQLYLMKRLFERKLSISRV